MGKRFIIKNIENSESVKDQDKLYRELSYLQVYQPNLMRERNEARQRVTASILSVCPEIGASIKQIYELYFQMRGFPVENKEVATLIHIVEQRQNSRDKRIYKLDSMEDVRTTNDDQIIRWFLRDIESWYNS